MKSSVFPRVPRRLRQASALGFTAGAHGGMTAIVEGRRCARRQPSLVRIVLAEDHAMVRSAIKALLADIAGVEVVGEAADGRELVALVDRLEPDLVMTDVAMPGLDGIAATAEIKAKHPGTPVLVLSMQDTADVVKHTCIGNSAFE